MAGTNLKFVDTSNTVDYQRLRINEIATDIHAAYTGTAALSVTSITVGGNPVTGGISSTDNLPEGSNNLYYTNERVDDRVNALVVASTGITKVYDDAANTYTLSVTQADINTDNITEGSTNLFTTAARTRSHISVAGSLAYNSGTGVISYTTPNSDGITEGSTNLYFTNERVDDRVNALFIAGTGITRTYDDAANTYQMSIGQAVATTSAVTFDKVTLGTSAVIDGPSVITIDPANAGTSGKVVIAGDLQVTGSTTTIDSTTLTTADLAIRLAKDAANNAAADGAGLEVKDANLANFKYDNTNGYWESNIPIKATSFVGIDADKISEGNSKAEIIDSGTDGRLVVETEGSERLCIDSDGMSKFTRGSGGTVAHFYANARESNILIQNDARTWKIVNYDYGNNGTDHLGFHDGTADRLIIGNTGQIGINATTWWDSACALTVYNGRSNSEHTILDIQADTNETSRISFSEVGDTNKGSIKYSHGNLGDYMTFHTNGTTEQLKINSGGDIFVNNGFVQISPTDHDKLKLTVPSGQSDDWAYITFWGEDGTRNAYMGTNAAGDVKIQRDGGCWLELGANATFSGTLDLPAVQGANNNHNSDVLFQTSAGVIDGGSGLTYNPAEDALKVNGTIITSGGVNGSGGQLLLTAANHSSTCHIAVGSIVNIKNQATFTNNDASAKTAARFENLTNNGAADCRIQVATYSNGGADPFIHFDAGGSNMIVGNWYGGTTNNKLILGAGDSPSGTVKGFTIDGNGMVAPTHDGDYDLGSSNKRWRNVYTADIQMNNTGTGGNEVDGSEGRWTVQEGAEDLFLINRNTGKKYKFNLTEVS